MYDDQEIGAQLHRLAANDPNRPISGLEMLQRGRKRRLRRRIATGASVAVAASVAAVVAAGLLQGLGSDAGVSGEAPVAGAVSVPAREDMFQPLPGVAHGDAALGYLGWPEAIRRCELRYPGAKYPAGGDSRHSRAYRAGFGLPNVDATGRTPTICSVPGDSKPSAAAIKLATSDPVPNSQTGMLHNCSVMFWHDFTDWKVVASERIDGVGASVLAQSPSGKYVVNCQLDAKALDPAKLGSGPEIIAVKDKQQLVPAELTGMTGFQTCGDPTRKCAGWVYPGGGRVDPRITRIRITAVNGKQHEVTVKNGWFALYWGDGDSKGVPGATVTAYDRNGAVVS
ncbi:MAG: hypothetical protein QOG10_6318 [Kribbellaceae bacterium]|jgi:hypothetical protein|nr:hypothetical protein [Kribbellaceae bacterium]